MIFRERLMAEETSIVLEALRDELGRHPADIVGALELADDHLRVAGGNMRLFPAVKSDPDVHPSVAHAHVIADVGVGERAARLDACVVGIDDDRSAALRSAMRGWVAAVASPLFSLVHARPVMG